QLMTALVSYAATPVQTAVIIYIALTGILILRGHASEGIGSLVSRAIKLSVVVWFATNGGEYATWVNDFFLVSLPNDLTQAVSSSVSGGTAISANSFDVLLLKSYDAGLQVWKLLHWYDIGEMILIVVFWAIAILACVVTFAIWFISHISLAVFVALGPLMVPLVLFVVTKPIFERWIGAMISAVIVQVVTVILLTITLEVESQLVTQLAGYTGTNPFDQMRTLLAACAFFAFAALLAFQIPGFGTALAGGLHFHTGAIARATLGVATKGVSTLASKAGAISQSADAAMLSGARSVLPRIGPTPGGSLSKASTPRT
ncbi:type IV secretion system protein, partial [Acetobacteraceae bacterium]|nr:type IV secretion system protein [Acetobacteraceae bacterium]